MTWFDREGREVRRVGAPEPVAGLALSPSGDRAVVARHVPHNVVDQTVADVLMIAAIDPGVS